MNVTLTQFKYAVAVEKSRNFRAAAQICHVTQPTLSMQIQKLEDQMGVILFDRSSQPITVTPMGGKILEQIRVVLNHTDVIQEIIDQVKNTLEGDLRLGIIPTLAPYLLPLFVDAIGRTHPEINLIIEETKTSDMIAQIDGNHLDMGLLVTPLDRPSIREVPLFEEPFYVFAGPNSPLAKLATIDETSLALDSLLLLAEGHCMRDQMVSICHVHQTQQAEGPRHLHFESGSIETLCHLVLKGLGFTVIPELALPWIANQGGHIIPFAEPTPTRQVSLIVHRSFVREGLLKAVSKIIGECLPSGLLHPQKKTKKIPIFP